jgi:hypothetical protein
MNHRRLLPGENTIAEYVWSQNLLTDLLQRLYFFDTAKQSAFGSCQFFIHTLCKIVPGVVGPYYSPLLSPKDEEHNPT